MRHTVVWTFDSDKPVSFADVSCMLSQHQVITISVSMTDNNVTNADTADAIVSFLRKHGPTRTETLVAEILGSNAEGWRLQHQLKKLRAEGKINNKAKGTWSLVG
jgi:hypothetical protein